MQKISIQEAANEAEKMFKFFKAFEKLDEALKMLAMYDQLIRERKEVSESLQVEIQNLSDKKALLVKGYDDDINTARINSENAAEQFRKEQKINEAKIIELQKKYEEEKSNLYIEYNILMKARQTELDNLLLEVEKYSKSLESAKKALNAIKAKLEV